MQTSLRQGQQTSYLWIGIRESQLAFDIAVVSLLNSNILSAAGATVEAAELGKHTTNDTKCAELRWVCIPLVVESYGAWGREA